MKTYQIVKSNGTVKESWEEINCDYIAHAGDVVIFYDGTNNPLIIYKLAEGEAVLFLYKD